MNKTFAAMLIVGLLFGNIIAQQNLASINKPPEISAELRKNAVDFLRQTVKEIPNLKAEENRQYFMIEWARLFWKYDEKEARAMFMQATREVKESIGKMAEKYKKTLAEVKKARANANVNYGYNNAVNRLSNVYPSNRYYSNAANTMANYESRISVYEVGMADEFRKIVALRKNLIDNLTDVEPSLAFQFLSETNQIIPEEMKDYTYASYSGPLESNIIVAMLERNEVDKALEVARSVFDKDFSESAFFILMEIYQKDAVKGSAFAEEILQKLKKIQDDEIGVNSLLIFFYQAVENKQEPSPLLNEKSLRELARLLGQNVLAKMDTEYYFSPYSYAKEIEKYAPREALKILQKSKQKRKNNLPRYPSNAANYPANYPYLSNRAYAGNAAANAVNAAARAANMAVNAATPAKSKNSKAKPKKTPELVEPIPVPDDFELPLDSKEELLQKLRMGKFTAEERKKIIELAKEYALGNNYYGYARPDGFIRVVGELARFSLISVDKEVADELMKEAEVYVRPETKNYADYVGKLLLAGGYSNHHPDKSFALMESMVTINEVIEHAVKFGIFVDFESSFIISDEVSASYFLGEMGITRNISREGELQMFIQNLAKADFQRTKGLADKFEKREFKMTAKMLILESLLGEMRESKNGY